ncbi:MAG: hypothetical protein QGF25_00350 [Candidatus Woesearchaeota archaeon]|jgi:hypothetical protein|nr:hypothetical protein [Candidatus Woesearchaeota archaeon]
MDEGHKHKHHDGVHSTHHKSHPKKDDRTMLYVCLTVAAVLLLFNQYQLSQLSHYAPASSGSYTPGQKISLSGGDLENVNVENLKSTAQTIAAVFPLDEVNSAQDAINMMVPTGIPSYGQEMGVTFDDAQGSLDVIAKKVYYEELALIKAEPENWERYLHLAARPSGIDCEFCCGIGAQGITANGEMKCGCAHNPGLLGLTMWLIRHTDMNDGEIMREVMLWKTLWFPRGMIETALKITGGDASALADAPGMVGGC